MEGWFGPSPNNGHHREGQIIMIVSIIRTAITDRRGVTAAEYAVMAVALVAAVTAGVGALAPRLLAVMGGLV